jgi:hypothetical protein
MLVIVAGLSSALAGFLMMFYAARKWGVAAWVFGALLFLLGSTSSGVGMIWLLGGDPPIFRLLIFLRTLPPPSALAASQHRPYGRVKA